VPSRPVATVSRVRAPPSMEAGLRSRRRPPWYRLWWVWTLAVLVALVLLLLFGHRPHSTDQKDDGVLYRILHRMGRDRAPKPE
jgi:type VI protein secretion system component VasF